ncbi:hypothetical protein LZC95_22720 [Pendulispora brunnea]|uniref:Uncharacterized protein n=1 Tax=Pendulispora brunnea TaxID=2905690 RepID=A0ABZ2KLT1_9BACT
MHDIDRTFMENDSEYSNHDSEYSNETDSESDNEEYEFQSEDHENEGEGVFSEDEVEHLAAELLSVSNEQELDHFIGSLAKRAFRKVRDLGKKVVSSSTFKNLVSQLRPIARNLLPKAGMALGNMIAPGIGGALGGVAAKGLGQYLGLELEGLSEEDQHYEIAKQFVRLTADASKRAAALPPGNPNALARKAIAAAAHKYAPGLVGRRFNGWVEGRITGAGDGRQGSGRWIRRGRHIVLLNV